MSVGAGSIKRAAKSALTDVAGAAAQKEKKPRTRTVKAEGTKGQDAVQKKAAGKKDSGETCQVGQQLPIYLL